MNSTLALKVIPVDMHESLWLLGARSSGIKTGINKKEVKTAIDAAIEVIKNGVKDDADIRLIEFATFKKLFHGARKM